VKPKLDDGARDSKIWASQADSLKVPHHIGMDNSSRGSTSKLTSYMPWRITVKSGSTPVGGPVKSRQEQKVRGLGRG